MGYAVYYRGEIEIAPPLTEGHRVVALALSKRELNDQTQPIFDAIAASPEPDLPWHTDPSPSLRTGPRSFQTRTKADTALDCGSNFW